MRDFKLRALAELDVFRDLSRLEMEEIDSKTTISTCKPGRIFYAPQETGEVLFILKSGRVQLYRLSREGKKLVVATLEAGAIFGEMSLIGQGMHNTFAEAIEDCMLCSLSRTDLEQLILDKPSVALRLLESMALRLAEFETKLEEMTFKSIPSRLAGLLLRLDEESEIPSLVQGYTHQNFAEELGTYRETTTQALNEFKRSGWIKIARKQIKILDREALQQLMEG